MIDYRLYYRLKPFLPWRLRITLRRYFAARKRRRCAGVWPILQSAATPPAGWAGWPDQREFAFVLTHDVEGPAGLERCRAIAELEMELGFRSAFNFTPEGSYVVPPALRTWLVEHGFEVGLHDLKHDGRLFASRARFRQAAQRLNRYLGEWSSTGFRAAFMMSELAWLHELNLRYDSSTFDTDPFEPRPDGVGTIFPFWISAPETNEPRTEPLTAASRGARSPRGYVELPYTLPQDSTLFLILRETSPAIWLQKLDWIAAHGGMALVNVHPDYVSLDDRPTDGRTYPLAYYRRLLEHVRETLHDRCWHRLPREVAEHVSAMRPRPTPCHAKRVCMITHSFYETDNRVSRYAQALAMRGDHVDVVALRRSADQPVEEVLAGVRLYRIQDRLSKAEQSPLAYLIPLVRFFASSSWWVTRHHLHRRYDLVHVHNMPDFLVFAAWYPKLTGAAVVLDVHDIVPEFYDSKFAGGQPSRTAALLRWTERRSARFAHHVIISNHLWLGKFAARTGTQTRCSVYINNVDTRVFLPRPRSRQDGKLIILFPGGLQWHQGVDLALQAFARLRTALPEAEFHVYGDGKMKPALVALAKHLGLDGHARFFEPVPIAKIAEIMANADLGIVPKRADSFGNEAYSTKILEFMSLGVPVVVSRTRVDQYYFDESVVRFFESGDVAGMAEAMQALLRDPALRRSQAARASGYAVRHSWEHRKADYLRLVDVLCHNRRTTWQPAAIPAPFPPAAAPLGGAASQASAVAVSADRS